MTSATPEEALACKKNVRAAHRSATRLINQAGSLLEATPRDVNELALLQTSLSAKLTKLEALNGEVAEFTPEAQLEDEVGRADEYSERIQRALLRLRKALILPPFAAEPVLDPPPRGPPADSHRDNLLKIILLILLVTHLPAILLLILLTLMLPLIIHQPAQVWDWMLLLLVAE